MLGRQYDPNNVVQNFSTALKVIPFMHEKDVFDDLFEGTEKFTDVLNMASNKLSVADIKYFHEYINKRLETVPLDLLLIEDVREPNPSISLDDEEKDMSEDESQEKSIQDSNHSQHKSQSSNHYDNEYESKNESPDKIIEDVIKGIDIHTEEGTGKVELLKASSK